MSLTQSQEELIEKLLSGELSKKTFADMRSNARRYNNLQLSIELAEVFETYKYRLKHAEERNKKSR